MTIDDIVKIVRTVIRPLQRKILLSIAHGLIEATKDTDGIQFIQATFLEGETKDDVRKMHHFGFTSHAPPGSECISVSVAGNREASVVIATENREYRFKNLGDGEVAIYSKDGDFIHLKNGNAIEISTKELTINAADDVTVNTKSANVNASIDANITSPTTTIDGNLIVTGEVVAQKSIAITENVTAIGDITGENLAGVASVASVNIAATTSLVVAGQELNDYENHTHDYQDTGAASNPSTTNGVN